MGLTFEDMRVQEIVEEVHKLNGKIPAHLVERLFSLHNHLFPDTKEFNKACDICKNRTFGRLQTYYNENILNKK